MPFLITARAVSHAIQMHDRYYEEYERNDWDQRKAIVAAFAELFVPTFSGILTDAFGVLVIMLVPIVMLRKLAIVASWWILAITISEMLLNPIVYYYLRAPDKEVVLERERGWYRNLIDWCTDHILSRNGKIATMVFWALLTGIGAVQMRGLIVGDPTVASPLVFEDSPYNVSHAHIQDKFGGVEPLIVVAEGHDRDAMKDPTVLRTMENFATSSAIATSATASRSPISCAPSTWCSTSWSRSGASSRTRSATLARRSSSSSPTRRRRRRRST